MPAISERIARPLRRLTVAGLILALAGLAGWQAMQPFLYSSPIYRLVLWPGLDSRAADEDVRTAAGPMTARDCEPIHRSFDRLGLKAIEFNILPLYTPFSPYQPEPFTAMKPLCGIDVTVRLRPQPFENYGPGRPADPPDTINVMVAEYAGRRDGRMLYSLGLVADTASRKLNWMIAFRNLSYDHAPLEWRPCVGRDSCARLAETLRRPEFHLRRMSKAFPGRRPLWMIEREMP